MVYKIGKIITSYLLSIILGSLYVMVRQGGPHGPNELSPYEYLSVFIFILIFPVILYRCFNKKKINENSQFLKRWLQKRKLAALLNELAIYNDKGIEWRHHNEQQKEQERQRLINSIQIQVDLLGRKHVSETLLNVISTDELKLDITGRYIKYAKISK